MKNVIAIIIMLSSISAYGAHELDVTALGSISGGNQESVDLGSNLRLELGNLESKAFANYQNAENKVYQQYLGSMHYAYPLGPNWSTFGEVLAERDTKQQVDFKTMEIVGAIYNIVPAFTYSLGIGHRLENKDNSLIASHRLKWEEAIGRVEPTAIVWAYHGYADIEIETTVGLRFRPYQTFRFGILGTHSYDSNPVAGVEKVDYSARAEFTLNLYSAG